MQALPQIWKIFYVNWIIFLRKEIMIMRTYLTVNIEASVIFAILMWNLSLNAFHSFISITKLFKLFSLNTYCLFLIQFISSHIFWKWWGTWSWDYWWENTKGGDIGETTQEKTIIQLTTHRRKVFLEKGVPRKQAKSLKKTPEGVHP